MDLFSSEVGMRPALYGGGGVSGVGEVVCCDERTADTLVVRVLDVAVAIELVIVAAR